MPVHPVTVADKMMLVVHARSCSDERSRRVLLLHVDDPRRGVGRGDSLMLVWLGDWMVSVPSGVV